MPALSKRPASVNLLPKQEEEKALTTRIIHWLLTTFRFLVITVELLVIIGFLSRFFLDSQNADLSDEITQKQALISSYLPFEKEFKTVQKRLEIAKVHYEGNTLFSLILETITKHITSSVQLVSVSEKENALIINVQGSNEQAIHILTQQLKEETLFADMKVTSIESVPNSNQVKATIKGVINKTT